MCVGFSWMWLGLLLCCACLLRIWKARIVLSKPLMRSIASFWNMVLSSQHCAKKPFFPDCLLEPMQLCVSKRHPRGNRLLGLPLSALRGCGWELECQQQAPVPWTHRATEGVWVEVGELRATGLESEAVCPWVAGHGAWKIGRWLGLGPAVWLGL